MRWEQGRQSENIEDRRGMRISPGLAGGGIGTIVIVLLAMFFGVDPRMLTQILPSDTAVQTPAPAQQQTGPDPMKQFVSVVLADTEDVWRDLFQRGGDTYREPTLVLFTGAVQSACGMAQTAVGPFYCPADQKVYIDLAFYQDLKDRFQAPGDFAQAYVIAHEVGHHVQNLLGIAGKVHQRQQQVSEEQANALSVRLELQADCLAGVWANHADRARHILEQGDVEEALNAASQIGDDRIQQRSRGYVSPDSFTHGTSEQRVRWFRQGLESGDLRGCDTFKSGRI
ncbi:MAG TPA: neutral zinc metallopeptidase [Burkholderiales bacterium]|nr:neutral zinc metallopeptidase [Burkholderiales bacterium]